MAFFTLLGHNRSLLSNPWHCGEGICELVYLPRYQNFRFRIGQYPEPTTCSSPSAFNRKSLSDLNCREWKHFSLHRSVSEKTITGIPFSSQHGFRQNHTVRMSSMKKKLGTWFKFLEMFKILFLLMKFPGICLCRFMS